MKIKFRAWDKGTEQMYSWESIKYNLNEHLEHHEVNVMAFTGLHDKNGKEIYVGDVINSWAGLEGATEHYFREVVIDDNHPEMRFEPSTGYTLCKSNEHLFEVVGNIFENPEFKEE